MTRTVKRNYDFSRGERGKFYRHGAISTSPASESLANRVGLSPPYDSVGEFAPESGEEAHSSVSTPSRTKR